MHGHRYAWMQRMLQRDNCVMDVNILRNLLQTASFFASITLLILVGLVTVLGSTDKAIFLIHALPFAATGTLVQWELKVLVLVVIFVQAFFKFTWVLRQFNYCSVLIGAAPMNSDDGYAVASGRDEHIGVKIFQSGPACLLFQSRGPRLVCQRLAIHAGHHFGHGWCCTGASITRR